MSASELLPPPLFSFPLLFFQSELVEKLIEARSLGKADPSLIDDFNKENLERK